ncbi:hypothetical protein F5Y16DRAFT_115969 [Xylariaceae sp. FL0255]|nr:hypothetical protein F5Y16DRAFT_115969 [Xylariaceae sp. FL0255]
MESQAEAPLLSRQEHDNEFENESLPGETNTSESDSGKRHSGQLGYFVWLLTLSAGISGLLFGCNCSHFHHNPSIGPNGNTQEAQTNESIQMIQE